MQKLYPFTQDRGKYKMTQSFWEASGQKNCKL